MEVADEPVLARLRQTTSARHLLLESVLQLVPPVDRRRYLTALTGFDLFLCAWEPRIASALPPLLRATFANRSRHVLLRRDLAMLGGRCAIEPALAQVCTHAAQSIELDSIAAAYGSMYVLEGSALGGQVIAKAVRESLGLGPDNGAGYFNGSRRETATHWAAFRNALEQQVGTSLRAGEAACAAARQTFDALIYTFAILRSHELVT